MNKRKTGAGIVTVDRILKIVRIDKTLKPTSDVMGSFPHLSFIIINKGETND
jgi:hypothetical protein